MSRSLRIAIVVEPLRTRSKGHDHAPSLARELLGLGHTVRGFGAAPGAIPRSGGAAEDRIPLEAGHGLSGFAPDVILAYDGLSPASWIAARRASQLSVPLVLVEEGFPDHGHWFQRTLRWVGELLWGPTVRRRAHRVIALDPVARAQALDDGFAAEDVVTLPSGVDLTRYRPGLTSRLPAAHGIRGRILLFLGRLTEEPGISQLLRAFAATVGRRGDWSLVMAGEGPAHVRLRAAADRLGVGAQVHWIGVPRREELPGILGASTLLVAPSLAEDVTGWRVRRALACGLPVLAGAGCRAQELIEHDGCGLLVGEEQAEDWEQALRLASGAPGRRRRWSERARELAEERFSWPRIAARLEAILLEACDAESEVEAPQRTPLEQRTAES
ncbi:MAG: glycosyltransferase family 4 protein [Planctomycetota bacterium]